MFAHRWHGENALFPFVLYLHCPNAILVASKQRVEQGLKSCSYIFFISIQRGDMILIEMFLLGIEIACNSNLFEF